MIINCVKLASQSRLIMSSKGFNSFALMFNGHAEAIKAVEKVDTSQTVNLDAPLADNQVLLQFLASTINPSDIGIIEGWYAAKPTFPSLIGNEGVAKVLKVGPKVTKLKVEDLVTPVTSLIGTWRTHGIVPETSVVPIDKDLDIFTACQMMVNPPTAYQLLKGYVDLKPGDTVMQNGANSAVGLLVIQLCKIWGYKSINIIRARPNPDDMAQLVKKLTDLGADYVVTDKDLANNEVMEKIWSNGVVQPKLTLDCIGGENANNCIKHMADEGTMVIYGTMTKEPIAVPAGPTIFKRLKFVGFWLANTFRNHPEEYTKMATDLTCMFKSGQLKAPPVVPVPMVNFKEAIEKATKSYIEGKVVLTNL